MRRVGRVTTAVAIAVVLLLLGGIGLGRVVRPSPPPPVPDAARTLSASPIVGSASLSELIGQLQARLRAVPDDWRSYATLGFAYVQQARITADPSYYPRAEGALDRSLELQPNGNFEALLGFGTLELARHDFDAALDHGMAAKALKPYSPAVYGVIGDALIELGRYDEAFGTFQEMIDRRPDLASYARASYAQELQGSVDVAIRTMEMAFAAAGGLADDGAWVSYQLGELHFGQGRLGEAARWYGRGAQLSPEFAPNAAGLAKVAAAEGDLSEAIAGYEEVVARYPSVEFVMALGDLYTLVGEDELAERQFDLVALQEELAVASGVDTDLEFALFHADHPGPGLDEALVRIQAEYERRSSVHVADALAWTLHALGRDAEAWGYAREALALGYRNATFHFHAGMIAAALGRDGEARRLLGTALFINPHFSVRWAPVAQETLEGLSS